MTHIKISFPLSGLEFFILKLGYISKNERYFFGSKTWIFLLHCLSLKYVVSDYFWWSYFPVHQNIAENVSILIKLARGADIWKSLSSACTLMWSLWKLFHPVSNDWNNFHETTYHLKQYRADKLGPLFNSEAFTFSSASLMPLIDSFNFD